MQPIDNEQPGLNSGDTPNGDVDLPLKTITGKSNSEKWLLAVFAVAGFDYLRLVYIVVISFYTIANDPYTPFRLIALGSYLDLLLWPFVLWVFYKRKRWGWLLFIAAKIITISTTLTYYFSDYLSVYNPSHFPFFILATFFLDIPVLIFLWTKNAINMFGVSKRTRMITFVSVAAAMSVLTSFRSSHKSRFNTVSTIETQTTEGDKNTADTVADPRLLSVINGVDKKTVDTTYMATGFYFISEKAIGVNMRLERAESIYAVAPKAFVPAKNISKAELRQTSGINHTHTDLCLIFDKEGTRSLEAAAEEPQYPYIAVVVANKLLYVLPNNGKMRGKVMNISLVGYSDKEMKRMCSLVNLKR